MLPWNIISVVFDQTFIVLFETLGVDFNCNYAIVKCTVGNTKNSLCQVQPELNVVDVSGEFGKYVEFQVQVTEMTEVSEDKEVQGKEELEAPNHGTNVLNAFDMMITAACDRGSELHIPPLKTSNKYPNRDRLHNDIVEMPQRCSQGKGKGVNGINRGWHMFC